MIDNSAGKLNHKYIYMETCICRIVDSKNGTQAGVGEILGSDVSSQQKYIWGAKDREEWIGGKVGEREGGWVGARGGRREREGEEGRERERKGEREREGK